MKSTKSTKTTKNTKAKTQPKTTQPKTTVPPISAMEKFKFEVASEIGVPLKKGYNGDLTAAQTGYVGGYMVKKMIEAQQRQMAGK